MTEIMKQASTGHQKALKTLYETHKQSVYYLCRILLKNPADAESATVWTFENSWQPVLDGKLDTEDDFHSLVMHKALSYCMNKMLNTDPNALKIPTNKDFLIRQINTSKISIGEGKATTALALMPPLQGFILVAKEVAGCTIDELAKLLNTDSSTITYALNAQKYNLSKIYDEVKKARGNALAPTEELVHAAFMYEIHRTEIPQKAEEQICQNIEVLTASSEKKFRVRNCIIVLSCVIVCITAIISGILLTDNKNNTDGTDENVISETATSSESNTTKNSKTDAGMPNDEGFNITEEAASDESVVDSDTVFYADISIEGYGVVTVALDSDAAPKTVENFKNLAESGFYDGLTFHRIIEGFMMQGGDPNGNGTGGSENSIVGEFSANGYKNTLSHTRGAISMARSNDYNSASSQFFIVHEDSPSLDGQYACFGYVTEGMDIVDAICKTAEPTDNNGTIPATEQPVITSIVIRETAVDTIE